MDTARETTVGDSVVEPGDAMRQARQVDSVRKWRFVESAVNELLEEGQPINVSRVAKRARASRQFIYSHPELLDLVKTAVRGSADLTAHHGVASTPRRERSHATDLLLAQDTIRKLRTELRDLREAMMVGLAAQVELRDETRARAILREKTDQLQKVLSENAGLRRELEHTAARICALEDDLVAERSATQRLLTRDDPIPINRSSARATPPADRTSPPRRDSQ